MGSSGRELAAKKSLHFGVAPEVGVSEAVTGGSEFKMYSFIALPRKVSGSLSSSGYLSDPLPAGVLWASLGEPVGHPGASDWTVLSLGHPGKGLAARWHRYLLLGAPKPTGLRGSPGPTPVLFTPKHTPGVAAGGKWGLMY